MPDKLEDNMAEDKITKKQLKLLKEIALYRKVHDDRPSMDYLVKTVGLSSNRSLIDMVNSLITKGYLKNGDKITKSFVLTSKATSELNLTTYPILFRLPWQSYQQTGGTS